MKNYSLFFLLFTILFSSCKEKKNSDPNAVLIKNEITQLTNKEVNSEGVFLFTSEEKQLISWTEHGKNKKETNMGAHYSGRHVCQR